MRELTWSTFKRSNDNKPVLHTGSWDQLKQALCTIQKKPRISSKDPDEIKKATPAFSGTEFHKGVTRSKEGAKFVHLLVFDIDNGRKELTGEFYPSGRPILRSLQVGDPATLDEFAPLLEKFSYVIYTTFNHRHDWPKYRIVLPLATPVKAINWESAAAWCVKELGLSDILSRGCIDVGVLKDSARMNFLPYSLTPSTIEMYANDGEALAVPEKLDDVLPATSQFALRTLTQGATENWWGKYPINFKTLDLVKLFGMLGLKVGKRTAYKNGFKWRCQCPWEIEHSHAAHNDDSGAIIQEDGEWPAFCCAHTSHLDVHLKDICELAGTTLLQACAAEFSSDVTEEVNVVEQTLRNAARATLAINKGGAILPVPGNLAKILRLDPTWGPRLSTNEMTHEVMYDGDVKDDHFVNKVQEWIQDIYHLNFPNSEVQSKLATQAAENMIHPVREWFKTLKWDGVSRIERIPKEILRSTSPVAQEYMRCALIGAVRRCFEPGVKLDTVVVFVGGQGNFKSTFWKLLVGEKWFNDSPLNLDDKDGAMVMHRKFCTELAELEGVTSNKAVERIRAFISSSTDIFRPPYGHNVVTFPRSNFLVGTANRDELLVDPTGSRRFWPIKCGRIHLELVSEWREQIWAEAVALYRRGVQHWLDETQEAAREEEAIKFQPDEPLYDQMIDALQRARENPMYKFSFSEGISMARILAFMDLPPGINNMGVAKHLGPLMTKNGWCKRQDGPKHAMLWHAPQEMVKVYAGMPAGLTNSKY